MAVRTRQDCAPGLESEKHHLSDHLGEILWSVNRLRPRVVEEVVDRRLH